MLKLTKTADILINKYGYTVSEVMDMSASETLKIVLIKEYGSFDAGQIIEYVNDYVNSLKREIRDNI